MALLRHLRLDVRARALLVVLTAGFVLFPALASPAAAQGYGWFGNLFEGGVPRPQAGAPAYPGYGYGPGGRPNTYYAQPRHRILRRKPVEQVQKEAPPKEKAPSKNATVFVDVFGDMLGQQLANGLDDALADRQDLSVVHKAVGSSGLVATARFDWLTSVETLLSGRDSAAEAANQDKTASAKPGPAEKPKPKIDVAVMMIGSNDRQPIEVDGKALKFGTPEWNTAYGKRVMAIDEAFRGKNIPLVWVGVPITKDDGFADDMAALNDIYRDAAAKTGAIFVDTWEAFSDDDGDFSAYGPDINGQTVRLRSADGVYFTKAGARKLAHFVETHIRRALDGKTPPPELPTAAAPPAPAPAGEKPIAVAKPDAGPIQNLNELRSTANGALSTVRTNAALSSQDSAIETIQHGTPVPVPAGRADDARWSDKAALEP